jgi:hypothetical protein
VWYSIADRRVTHPEQFKADMAALFDLLREGAIPSLSTDYRSRPRARSMTELMPAVSAGRSCYYPGPSRNEAVAF